MPVQDAEVLLRDVIRKRLEELVGEQDLTATFHLFTVQQLVLCEGSEETSEDDSHYYEETRWKLSLFIRIGSDRYVSLVGSVPHVACSDGDPEPMLVLIDRMWQDYQFGSLMVGQDMEEHLNEVASEIEGPG